MERWRAGWHLRLGVCLFMKLPGILRPRRKRAKVPVVGEETRGALGTGRAHTGLGPGEGHEWWAWLGTVTASGSHSAGIIALRSSPEPAGEAISIPSSWPSSPSHHFLFPSKLKGKFPCGKEYFFFPLCHVWLQILTADPVCDFHFKPLK